MIKYYSFGKYFYVADLKNGQISITQVRCRRKYFIMCPIDVLCF